MVSDIYTQASQFGIITHALAAMMYPPKEGILIDSGPLDDFIAAAEKIDDSELASKVIKIKDSLQTEAPDELANDHASLMVGPFELLAPPYGSVYLEKSRKIMGDTTMEVGQFYFDCGLEVASDYNDPPDHIAVEMEFIHFLFAEISKSLNENNKEAAENYEVKLREFLNKYYLPFAEDFAKKIKDNAETNVYKYTGDAILHINNFLKNF